MQLTKQQSRVVPRRGHQTDKYQGELHPTTKLRHGRGQYQYDNQFFAYDGQYLQGKKQGKGILTLRDGTTITAAFEQDQLVGPAEVKYSHGAVYKGNLVLGEKDGKGVFDSQYEFYDGEWKDNNKHGKGTYKNKSTNQEYIGEFQKNNFHGNGKLTSWNYSYQGEFQQGKKEGKGKQINEWPRQNEQGRGRYEYNGQFKQNEFEGEGEYKSKQSQYVYTGSFSKGQPTLYPNEFKLWLSTNSKNGQEIIENQKTLIANTQPIDFQLQGDSINFYIDTVYQGPEVLDQIQPTQQEIEGMIKNWQNQNKKNKNPPPMPDFTQPRMKKPQVVKVKQESGRTISLRLIKQVEGKDDYLKIDYRAEMAAKRKENEEIKLQALKKAEQDAGKKGGKKDNKEPELKVNLFKDKPTKRQTVLNIYSASGSSQLKTFQLPDDFPPGKYILQVSSPFIDFGRMQTLRKQINVKAKVAAKKK